ncbi:HAD-superfamily subfamily IIA hydrolase [Apiospora arundinis]
MNKLSILYCKHCSRGCDQYCFDGHRSRYYCHDRRCPGFDPPRDSSLRPEVLSRSSSKRYTSGRSSSSRPSRPGDGVRYVERREPPRSATPSDRLCTFKIEQTGEILTYPRDPNRDRDHLNLLMRHPAPKRGYRYAYDRAGNTVTLPVGPEADDYYDPADAERSSRSRRPSRSASTSYRDGGDQERRSYSSAREIRREPGGNSGLGRSYSTRETRRDYDEGGGLGAGLGRRLSVGRGRNYSSRDDYAGGGGGSYDSMRSRHPPESFSRSYSTRRGRSESFLRPEAAYEEPRQRVVKPEDVDWEIETVVE